MNNLQGLYLIECRNKMNNSLEISLGNPGLLSQNFAYIMSNQAYLLKLIQQFLCNFHRYIKHLSITVEGNQLQDLQKTQLLYL